MFWSQPKPCANIIGCPSGLPATDTWGRTTGSIRAQYSGTAGSTQAWDAFRVLCRRRGELRHVAPLNPGEQPVDVLVDVLGAPYTAETIALAADDEGEVVATLVNRRAATPTRRAVLHLHGFAEYFFQTPA